MIDDGMINNVTVSPQSREGHFRLLADYEMLSRRKLKQEGECSKIFEKSGPGVFDSIGP